MASIPLVPRIKIEAQRFARRLKAAVPEWLVESLPHLPLPVALIFICWTTAAWYSLVFLLMAASLRHKFRSNSVFGVSDALNASGLVLLPENDNKIVEEFIQLAKPADVQRMVDGLCVGAEVTLYNLEKNAELNGRTCKIVAFFGDRIGVEVDGRGMAFYTQNLSQHVVVWGRTFRYTRV
ncbi:hypothetical protein DIPPA_12015 [Diplonema papillatum]|nr:hypothetical protein DIPPA_12015 [Diplonema papillatum]|eukprot:gene15336-23443_t